MFYVKNRFDIMARLIYEYNIYEILDFGGSDKRLGDLKTSLRKLFREERDYVKKERMSKQLQRINIKTVDINKDADIVQDLNKNFKFSTQCIIAAEIIEHLIDPKKFLENCYKSLKKGGYLILTTPNFGFWRWRLQSLTGNVPETIKFYKNTPDQHIHVFNWQTLEELLENAKFKLVQRIKLIKFPFFLGFQPNVFLICKK